MKEFLLKDLLTAAQSPLKLGARRLLKSVAIDLKGVLISVIESYSRLDAIARRSYKHDNGFMKIVLSEAEHSNAKVRFHIWKAPAVVSSDIHDHFWDFSSIVVKGALETVDYRVSQHSGESFQKFELVAHSHQGQHTLLRMGTELLEEKRRRVIASGEVYSLSAWRPHRVSPANGGETYSLVLQGPHLKKINRVFRRSMTASVMKSQSKPITVNELRASLVNCISELDV